MEALPQGPPRRPPRARPGSSGMYPDQCRATPCGPSRPESDERHHARDAVERRRREPGQHHAPSGALARAPAPRIATPTSGVDLRRARPTLELVNFRDPSAERAGRGNRRARTAAQTATATRPPAVAQDATGDPRAPSRRSIVARRRRLPGHASRGGARSAPPAPTPAPVVPTPLEFPEPEARCGRGRPRSAAPPVAAAPGTHRRSGPRSRRHRRPRPRNSRFSSPPSPSPRSRWTGRRSGRRFRPARSHLDEGEHTVRLRGQGLPPLREEIPRRPEIRRTASTTSSRVSMLVIQAPGWAGARRARRRQVPGHAARRGPPQAAAGLLQRDALARGHANPVTEKIDVPEGAPKTWNAPPPSPAAAGRRLMRRRLGLALALSLFAGARLRAGRDQLEAEAKRAFDSGRFKEAGDKYAKAAEAAGRHDRAQGRPPPPERLVLLHRRQLQERARRAQGRARGATRPAGHRGLLQPRLRQPRVGRPRRGRGSQRPADRRRGAEALGPRKARRRQGRRSPLRPQARRQLERPGGLPHPGRGRRPARPDDRSRRRPARASDLEKGLVSSVPIGAPARHGGRRSGRRARAGRRPDARERREGARGGRLPRGGLLRAPGVGQPTPKNAEAHRLLGDAALAGRPAGRGRARVHGRDRARAGQREGRASAWPRSPSSRRSGTRPPVTIAGPSSWIRRTSRRRAASAAP